MASQKATDEEAQKRNTDCVYFLASPLTCKKGTDCEYRHSESARINPRDCWFWLSGSCLNPNCPFRHPPLDGRPTASSTPGVLPVVPVAPVAPVLPTKRVPCFFFSQGFCAKGDKCVFMHGPQLAPSVEATSQKPPKPVNLKNTESTDKQVYTGKGNGSASPKPILEASQEVHTSVEIKPAAQSEGQFVHAKPTRPTQEAVLRQNDTTKVKAAEGSGSSGPTRPSGRQLLPVEERLRQVPIGEERTTQVQPADERFRQVLSGEDRMRQVSSQVQPADDRMRHVQSGEERMQNGIESEEWWEESSPGFDVLVDDGPDQHMYPDDTEYLPHHDVLVESGRSHSRGRLMHSDDLTEFEYDHPGVYDQSGYYDASSGQYDHGPYDPYEQQLGYDHLNSYDHLGRQQAVLYNDRAMDGMLVRERRGLMSEGDIRHSAGSGDLRNRITKRRRLEGRTQQLAGDNHHRRSRQDILVNDFQHRRRHQDDYPRQQDVLMRHHVSIQQGTRPNHRRSHGRAESGGNKRAYHDVVSEYGGISPERISVKSSPNKRILGERVRTKSRERERGRFVSEAIAVPPEIKSYNPSNSRKAEIRKDDTDFTGPKSLAQIKAEKRKAIGQESMKARDVPDEHKSSSQPMELINAANERQILPLKSQISPAPGSVLDTARKEALVAEDRKASGGKAVVVQESFKTVDFEGPKPLRAILEAKRKADLEGGQQPEDVRKEHGVRQTSFRPVTGAASASNVISGSPLERGLENAVHSQDHNPVSTSGLQHANGIDMRRGGTPVQVPGDSMQDSVSVKDVHALWMRSDNRELAGEVQGGREGEDVGGRLGTSGDMEVETEPGDNALEDDEFGLDDDDDDDDDDFAKKLGGFFS